MRKISLSESLLFFSVVMVALTLQATFFWGKSSGRATRNLVSNPGLEDPVAGNGLPDGWSLSVNSGEYEHRVHKPSHTGKHSLAFAGSGGTGVLRTNPIPITRNSVLACDVWYQTELFKEGTLSASIESAKQPSKSSFPLDQDVSDWRLLQFFQGVHAEGPDQTVSLALRLTGEGLVKIDDVRVSFVDGLEPTQLIDDHSFERPASDGTFPEWRLVNDGSTATAQSHPDQPEGGRSCVRIEGEQGYAVLLSRHAMAANGRKFLVQAFVRARRGTGNLKIDYFAQGSYLRSSMSRTIGSQTSCDSAWSVVYVESDPGSVSEADEIRIGLAATSLNGRFDVDFDNVELFATH